MRIALAFVSALLVAPLAAAPPESAANPEAPGLEGAARVEALLARVAAAQKEMRTLRARFTQRNESELLVAPEEATGTFAFVAPDRVRWEYESPRPMTVVVTGAEMTTWYRDLKRAERLNIGKYSNQVMRYLGASASFESLKQHFDVSFAFPKDVNEPYRVDLKPRFAHVARRIGGMTIWIDRRNFLASRLRIVEAGGDVTEFRFAGVEVNAALPEALFDLELPADVQVKTLAPGSKPTGPSGPPS